MNSTNYYPFGMIMPGRKYSGSDKHSYGFQGQLLDDEVKGENNSVNYKFRMHDPRVGRFFAMDPLAGQYPNYTPYSFSGNKLIHKVELEGMEEKDHMFNLDPSLAKFRDGNSYQENRIYKKVFDDAFIKTTVAGLSIVGLGVVVVPASGAALASTSSATTNAMIWMLNPANQALVVEGFGVVGGIFYEGPEDLSPGAGDEIGKVLRKAWVPVKDAFKYSFQSSKGIVSTGSAKLLNGVLELDFHITSELQKKGIGTTMFADAMVQFGDNVKAVKGLWTMDAAGKASSNLDEFWKYADDIYTDKQAAFMTPTGKMAKANGFTEVKIKYAERDEVEVLFSKPEKK